MSFVVEKLESQAHDIGYILYEFHVLFLLEGK